LKPDGRELAKMSFNLSEMQSDLRAAGLHGWLFYDFRGRDPIAQRVTTTSAGMRTRRWFYFVPQKLAKKNSSTNRDGVACGSPWRNALLLGARRAAWQSKKAHRPRQKSCDAVFAEK